MDTIKKRMISLVLALAMCLSLCTTVFAEDATHEITEENYRVEIPQRGEYFLVTS